MHYPICRYPCHKSGMRYRRVMEGRSYVVCDIPSQFAVALFRFWVGVHLHRRRSLVVARWNGWLADQQRYRGRCRVLPPNMSNDDPHRGVIILFPQLDKLGKLGSGIGNIQFTRADGASFK